MERLLAFHPIYQERVWGGRGLASQLGRELPGEGPYGESWDIVDREEAQSVVRGGEYAGSTLRALLAARGREILGPRFQPGRSFPILVKWLDCRERLSLQVHPPAEVAGRLGGQPKTENWYMAACDPGARLLVGLREGTRREDFEAALDGGALEPLVIAVGVSAGDSVLVESGQIHAIDAGNLILEIQQNSDTTYRVYDWGRVGLDGKPRTLHREESLASIRFGEKPPQVRRAAGGSMVLAEAAEFRIRKFSVEDGGVVQVGSPEEAVLLHGVEGIWRVDAGAVGATAAAGETRVLARGDNLLLGAGEPVEWRAEGRAALLVTDRFL